MCSSLKGWAARRGTQHSASEYPGTAIRWEGELFEVVDALTRADRSIVYRLEPWEHRHAIRSIRNYDASTEGARGRERERRLANVRKRRLAILLSPLAGHLPGWVQQEMESEFGAPALAMTIVSALPLLVLGFLGVFFVLAAHAGAGFEIGAEAEGTSIPRLLPLPLALYLFVESAIRLGTAFLQARPIGSLPGTVLFEAWNTFRGRPHSPPLGMSVRRESSTAERADEDRYRMLEPLLGLLSPAEQKRLSDRFVFEPVLWGRRSAVLLGVVAGSNVAASLLMLAAGAAGAGDILWLAPGSLVLLEQALRWRSLSRGRPAGSVFGALVRPLARKLL